MTVDGRLTPHAFMPTAELLRVAERALQTGLRQLPLLTVFGAWSDYFGFQSQWKQRSPDARQVRVGRYHFPMAGSPTAVAAAISSWHTETITEPPARRGPRGRPH